MEKTEIDKKLIQSQTKELTGKLTGKSYEKSGKTFYPFVITSEILDRDNEIVNVDGIDYANFLNNAVCFYNHKQYNLPIGIWNNVKKDGTRITADLFFHEIPDDDGNNVSAILKQYVDLGIINSVSIGFTVNNAFYLPVITPDLVLPNGRTIKIPVSKMEKLKRQGVLYFESTELVEISLVNIPSNAESIAIKALNTLIINDKSGRVLSSANLERLRNAISALTDILNIAESEPDTPDTGTGSVEPVKSLIPFTPDDVKFDINVNLEQVETLIKENFENIKDYFNSEFNRILDFLIEKEIDNITSDDDDSDVLVIEPDEPEPDTPDEPEPELISIDDLRNFLN